MYARHHFWYIHILVAYKNKHDIYTKPICYTNLSFHLPNASSWYLCLFPKVATRDNWISAMVSPLVKTEPLLLVIFGSYFCIGALALMNSIIAVVVECTLSAAKASSDKEEEEKQRADVP